MSDRKKQQQQQQQKKNSGGDGDTERVRKELVDAWFHAVVRTKDEGTTVDNCSS